MKKTLSFGAAIALAGLLVVGCKSDSSPWIWKIEGKTTTVKQFEAAYEGYLMLMKEQFQMMSGRNLSTEEFKELISAPERIPNPQIQQLFRGLQKKNFAEQYKMMLILNQEAGKTGFLKRDDIRARIDYMQKYFIANMYMMERVKPSEITVEEADAVRRWERIKASDPRYRTIPFDQGLEMAKQEMQGQMYKQKQEETVTQIKEQYKVEPNENFSLAEYLKADAQNEEKKKAAEAEAGSENK